MTPPTNPKALGAERLQARKRRVSLIRRRVVAIAVALFIATTAGILIQLASGHDPALAAADATTSSSSSNQSSSTQSGSDSSSSGSTATAGSSSSSQSSSSPSSVATSSS